MVRRHDWRAVFKIKVTTKIKISVNAHPEDTIWAAEPFVTQPGMVMQNHEPVWYVRKDLFAVFKVNVTMRAHMIKTWPFLPYLFYEPFASKLSLSRNCLLVSLDLRSQQMFKSSLMFLSPVFSAQPYQVCTVTKRCKQSRNTLTVTLWLTGSLSTQWGIYCRARPHIMFFYLVRL